MKIKEITKRQGLEIASSLAEYNERGRLLVTEAHIADCLIEKGFRLRGKNACESAAGIFAALKNRPGTYEYEPGRLHLNLTCKKEEEET
ncbi:MAG: hypothetical protein OCU18_03760 [Candidatus Syntrophoarchaeum sp.]|nr:hypothetical protein [Candidatus Syntrophoarchaeum sp.]